MFLKNLNLYLLFLSLIVLNSCSSSMFMPLGIDHDSALGRAIAQQKIKIAAEKTRLAAEKIIIDQGVVVIKSKLKEDPALTEQYQQAGRAYAYCDGFTKARNEQIVNVKCSVNVRRYDITVKSDACFRAQNKLLPISYNDQIKVCNVSTEQRLIANSYLDSSLHKSSLEVIKEYAKESNITKWDARSDFPYLKIEIDEDLEDKIKIASRKARNQISRESERESRSSANTWAAVNNALKAVRDNTAASNAQMAKDFSKSNTNSSSPQSTSYNKSKSYNNSYNSSNESWSTAIFKKPIVAKIKNEPEKVIIIKDAPKNQGITLGAGNWSDIYGIAPKFNPVASTETTSSSNISKEKQKAEPAKIKSVELVVGSVGIGYEKSISLSLAQTKVMNYTYKACGNISRAHIEWSNPLCYAKTKTQVNVLCKQPANVVCYTSACSEVSESCGSQASLFRAPRSSLTITDKAAYDLLDANHKVLGN